MPSTSYPDFNDQTEGQEVAKVFAGVIKGKTVIVTGVNRGGIGFTTAEAFASQSPTHLIITGRNPSKIQECIDVIAKRFPTVKYYSLHMDLSSQQSVRAAAAEVLSWSEIPSIDIIVNSAGVMLLPERTITDDGIEMHFATNHIGHFLFTCTIMPKLIKASHNNPKGATRIVNVSSLSPTWTKMRWSDLNFEKRNKDLPKIEQPGYEILKMWGYTDPENMSYVPLEGYNQSKAANLLFSIAANKRLYGKYGILSLTVHPGVIQTELGRNMESKTADSIQQMMQKRSFSFKTLGAGASTSLVAALDPKLEAGKTVGGIENYGTYLIDCQISDKAHPLAVSSDEAEKLWELSENLVKTEFAW